MTSSALRLAEEKRLTAQLGFRGEVGIEFAEHVEFRRGRCISGPKSWRSASVEIQSSIIKSDYEQAMRELTDETESDRQDAALGVETNRARPPKSHPALAG